MAGLPLPITTSILQACVTEPVKPFLDKIIVSAQMHIYVSQTDRGEFLIGAEVEPYPTYSSKGTFAFIEAVARTCSSCSRSCTRPGSSASGRGSAT